MEYEKCCKRPKYVDSISCSHIAETFQNGPPVKAVRAFLSAYCSLVEYQRNHSWRSNYSEIQNGKLISPPCCRECHSYTGRLHLAFPFYPSSMKESNVADEASKVVSGSKIRSNTIDWKIQQPLVLCLRCLPKFWKPAANGNDIVEKSVEVVSIELNTLQFYCHACKDHVYPSMKDVIAHKDVAEPGAKSNFVRVAVDDHLLGVRGLCNLGNTCYLNVILQCLLNNPLVINFFVSEKHCKHGSKICRGEGEDTRTCVSCELGEVFNALYSTDRSPYCPFQMLRSVWSHSEQLVGYTQHDAHELLLVLLNILHGDSFPERSEKENRNCPCLAHCLFSGETVSEVTCATCKTVSSVQEFFFILSLNISGSLKRLRDEDVNRTISLDDCMESFCKLEELEEQVFCSKCKVATPSSKKMSILRPPLVLCLQLKRFEQTSFSRKKDSTRVTYPAVLNIDPYMGGHDKEETGDGMEKIEYRLVSVVNHIGSLDSGHYVCHYAHATANPFPRFSNGNFGPTESNLSTSCSGPYVSENPTWFKCDDHIIRPLSQEEVLGTNAYLLFYVRK